MKGLHIPSMLLIATIAALAAVAFASCWLVRQSGSGITKIAVATTDIGLGQRLSPEATKLVSWPASSLPPGTISDPHALDGCVVCASLTRDEPILDSKLTPVGTADGLSVVVAEGKRAITVRVNDVMSVAGFALSGNYVDIIVDMQQDSREAKPDADRNDQSISEIVLEEILVLAVAQEVSHDDTKPKVVNAVTLKVTPEQVEKIDLTHSVGNLLLVLRNQVDSQRDVTTGATKSALLKEPVVNTAVAMPVVKTVQIVYHVAECRSTGNYVGVINDMWHSQECF